MELTLIRCCVRTITMHGVYACTTMYCVGIHVAKMSMNQSKQPIYLNSDVLLIYNNFLSVFRFVL